MENGSGNSDFNSLAFASPWRYIPMYAIPMAAGYDLPELSKQDDNSLLPPRFPSDPRQWTRQQVGLWLEWCVQQFSLPPVDLENFHMNGRALCLLTKSDFKDRVPRVGDVLFNTLHILIHKSSVPNVSNILLGQAALPEKGAQEPSRNWSKSIGSDLHSIGYIMRDNGSTTSTSSGGDVDSTVILSPAPSTEDKQPAESKGGELEPNNNNLPSDDEEEMVVNKEVHPLPTFQHTGNPPSFQINPNYPQEKSVRLLWDFLQQLLNDPQQRYKICIIWKDKNKGVFKIVDPHHLAYLWGMQKNHLNMNFDKMSRALRYYYRVKILQKEPGERHCYRFLRHPRELRNCKQRNLLTKDEGEAVLDMTVKEEWTGDLDED